jgi:hypothetical protein
MIVITHCYFFLGLSLYGICHGYFDIYDVWGNLPTSSACYVFVVFFLVFYTCVCEVKQIYILKPYTMPEFPKRYEKKTNITGLIITKLCIIYVSFLIR